jgi:ribonuclease HI
MERQILPIFIDGCCIGNHQKEKERQAGWALLIPDLEIKIGSPIPPDKSTNQIAEMTALGVALEIILLKMTDDRDFFNKYFCRIFSDSRYVVETMTKWAPSWERCGWIKADGKIPAHLLMIQEIYRIFNCLQTLGLELIKIDGHQKGSDVISRGNNEVDELAKSYAIQKDGLMYLPKFLSGV